MNIFFKLICWRGDIYVCIYCSALIHWPSSLHKTLCKYECMILSHDGSKILTACRMLQISIAHRQMKAKIHSFPTMYILGGGRCGRNGSNQGFRPRIRPKNIYFSGTKSWSSDFGGVWDPQILKCYHFRHYPSKVWWISVKMSYGHVR